MNSTMKGYGPVLLLIASLTSMFALYAYREWDEFDPLKAKSIQKSKDRLELIQSDPVYQEHERIVEKYAPLLVATSCNNVMSFEQLASSEYKLVRFHFQEIYNKAETINPLECKLMTRPEALPYREEKMK